MSLWDALVMDLGLVVFFLVYTFVFNWAFDCRASAVPASAAGRRRPQPQRVKSAAPKERCSAAGRQGRPRQAWASRHGAKLQTTLA